MCVIVSVRSGCMACFRSCACKLSGGATAKRQRYPRGTGDSERVTPDHLPEAGAAPSTTSCPLRSVPLTRCLAAKSSVLFECH